MIRYSVLYVVHGTDCTLYVSVHVYIILVITDYQRGFSQEGYSFTVKPAIVDTQK